MTRSNIVFNHTVASCEEIREVKETLGRRDKATRLVWRDIGGVMLDETRQNSEHQGGRLGVSVLFLSKPKKVST
jgi:hypothetical protein